jgi:hypothetical protein
MFSHETEPTMKRMILALAPALLTWTACADAPVEPAASDPGLVDVQVEQHQVGQTNIDLSITNHTAAPVSIVRSQLPLWGDARNLFQVSQAGRPVPVRDVALREPAAADDLVTVAPGKHLKVGMDLSVYFDFAAVDPHGTFDVAYVGAPLQDSGAALAIAGPAQLDLTADPSLSQRPGAFQLGGELWLSMSTSEKDRSSTDSGFKLYIHGVKYGTLSMLLDVIVGNYSSGGNARTYDVDIDTTVYCPGVGPSFPPHSLGFFVNTALDAGESHTMKGIGCDTIVPPEKGYSVAVDVSFEQENCNALSCN